MDAAIERWKVVAPETKNALSPSQPFNLMFSTSIGPSGQMPGFLRPETAQGIFVNFKRLLESVGGKMPFACAQIGLSFRNEISPRQGLLRVREFAQAEIEHFVRPDRKDHPRFDSIRSVTVRLFPREQQLTTRKTTDMTIGAAVDEGIVDNQTLGYFIARTSLFVKLIGMNQEHIRFRQHLENEMAHYAKDCWDLEVETSYGWIECAGLADRAAYDLSNHSKKSKTDLVAREVFDEVKVVDVLVAEPVKGLLGRKFKKEAQAIMEAMTTMSESELQELQTRLESGPAKVVGSNGTEYEVSKDMVNFKTETKKISGENYFPSVIEPSFGIGRLVYCLFEHAYYCREGAEGESAKEQRNVLGLAPEVAPMKCVVLPLSKNAAFDGILSRVSTALGAAGLINRVDDSGASIGKRYSRADEVGTPFGITVDFQSAEDGSVTLRERDSLEQVRGTAEDIVEAVHNLCKGRERWSEITARFPRFDASEE
eukprot:Plantae.Rhodophyta-Rhodochaete_pulchella.ctg610.p1 GENE.Plantae.Rhodophyta-Rhodochaete_pulchella.ctg610~~Plantae.Rhodophyta-Rhodochaete_pulchella.ctg610.p1  ORF type:complete len:534 (-),score=114.90 Plantae.Rhodophyta-Rhodochaete_pulchella.ctg610:761-2209(-)